MPCSDLKWNLTQKRSFFALMKAEGVRGEAVHVAVSGGQAAVRHEDGDLMQRLGQQRPEVPVVFRAAHVCARIALDRVVEVGELQRITQEEHRRVVAGHVPVAFLGVELDREAADVALGVGRTALTGNGGEARKYLGFLADLREELGAGVLRNVVGDGECAIGAGTLGVHAALGNHFAIEVGELFQKPDVLQQLRDRACRRSSRSGCRRRGSRRWWSVFWSCRCSLW